MNRVELKDLAKEVLRGKWFDESVILLIVSLITGLPTILLGDNYPLLDLILSMLLAPVGFGYARHVLMLTRGETVGMEDIFYYYKSGVMLDVIVLSVMVGVFTFLWSLLFLIPGIIAAHRYAMYQYIKSDYPELKFGDNLKLSSDMMYGHKFNYFVLHLSFLGWIILGGITLVGILPVAAYIATTEALFYERVRQEHLDRQLV